MYAGTVSDFSGLDPLIYKDPLRTEQYDFKHLNGKTKNFNIFITNHCSNKYVFFYYTTIAAPNFVSSVADGDYVYFFLRETAVEYINCGKVKKN